MVPLGSLRSWTFDAVLTGVLMPPVLLGTSVLTLVMLIGQGGGLGDLFEVMLLSALLGGAVGLLLGAAAWAAARLSWGVPLLTLSLGPLLGVLSTVLVVNLLSWAIEGGPPELQLRAWLPIVGLGAFAIGPPWVAYVGVRSRGRPGWPVVLATLLWASAVVVLLVAFTWVRQQEWGP